MIWVHPTASEPKVPSGVCRGELSAVQSNALENIQKFQGFRFQLERESKTQIHFESRCRRLLFRRGRDGGADARQIMGRYAARAGRGLAPEPQDGRAILLSSRYAMWMGWGEELTFFYNDAYRPTLGVKHRLVIGSAGPRGLEGDLARHRAADAACPGNMAKPHGMRACCCFLERSGYPEETYHTFSYSARWRTRLARSSGCSVSSPRRPSASSASAVYPACAILLRDIGRQDYAATRCCASTAARAARPIGRICRSR